MLKNLPSALVWMYTPSLQSLKAYWRSMEKKMPKNVGARTQPCFTPMLTGKASEVAPLKHNVLCMLSWNDVTTASWCGGAADLLEEFEESAPADQVKSLR